MVDHYCRLDNWLLVDCLHTQPAGWFRPVVLGRSRRVIHLRSFAERLQPKRTQDDQAGSADRTSVRSAQ